MPLVKHIAFGVDTHINIQTFTDRSNYKKPSIKMV